MGRILFLFLFWSGRCDFWSIFMLGLISQIEREKFSSRLLWTVGGYFEIERTFKIFKFQYIFISILNL